MKRQWTVQYSPNPFVSAVIPTKSITTPTAAEVPPPTSLPIWNRAVVRLCPSGARGNLRRGTCFIFLWDCSINPIGTERFAIATQRAMQRQETIAIYYDDKFISVPGVSVVITNGEAIITGMANAEDAERLASNIRNGALKLELQELRSNVVGAQLGSEAITTCLQAGVIGVILVAIFMVAV